LALTTLLGRLAGGFIPLFMFIIENTNGFPSPLGGSTTYDQTNFQELWAGAKVP
jgi:hypothetical protein